MKGVDYCVLCQGYGEGSELHWINECLSRPVFSMPLVTLHNLAMCVDVLLLITRPTANKMDHTTLTTVMTCIAWKLTSTNNKTRSYFKFGFLPFGKQRDLGSNPPRLSFLFKEVVACGHCLATLSLTINETFKRLPSLPILMQESFWWWQCSDGYIISLSPSFPHLLPVRNKTYGFCGR